MNNVVSRSITAMAYGIFVGIVSLIVNDQVMSLAEVLVLALLFWLVLIGEHLIRVIQRRKE